MANPPGSILVTGANGSLGFEIVKRVLSTPGYSHHSGLYTVRDSSSIPAFRESLHLAVKTSDIPRYDVLALDLSDLSSVRETADIINKRVAGGELPRIQALILNAGWTEFTTQSYSKDGFDMAFATNYLGHWLLTLLLLKSMDTESGRIVIVSSLAHE
jgi:NAD(P)-dependent dehydrogenase (short-subunit alcohol dehydrogenase family)